MEKKPETNINERNSVQLTVPLHITVQLGNPLIGEAINVNSTTSSSTVKREATTDFLDFDDLEVIRIDPDYSNRKGYDPNFLGVEIKLPELTQAQNRDASVNSMANNGSDPTVLPYNHFSIVINRKRRMAYYTACNIDGDRWIKIKRKESKNDRDTWHYDPRIPILEQTGERHYAHRKIDRGHLVRREDPNWGDTLDEAKKANDDTFHFTNCTPQHSTFNQRGEHWQGIENFILENAKAARNRVTVFTGPIFKDDDPFLDGVQVPLAFWKIVIFKEQNGNLTTSAYVLEQNGMIADILEAVFDAAEFQVSIKEIIDRTNLNFSHLTQFDALNSQAVHTEAMNLENVPARIPLHSFSDIQI